MDNVNIYIETRIRTLRARRGLYAYLLEFIDSRGYPRTKTGFGELENTTETRLALTAATEALKRFRKPCAVRVNTECGGVLNALSNGWVWEWKKQDWKNAKGDPVKNGELWKECTGLLENHLYSFETGHHAYKARLQYDLKRIEAGETTAERLNRLENSPPNGRQTERRYE